MAGTNLLKIKLSNIEIVNDMTDYSKEPTSLKRAEQARKFLEKHPLPKSFTKVKKVKQSYLKTKTKPGLENC